MAQTYTLAIFYKLSIFLGKVLHDSSIYPGYILQAEYILRTAFGTTTKYKLFLKYFLKFS